MKILNGNLPAHLQGQNRKDYEHNLDNYRGKRFTMYLKNGDKMPVEAWTKAVSDWHSKLGIQTHNEKGEVIMDSKVMAKNAAGQWDYVEPGELNKLAMTGMTAVITEPTVEEAMRSMDKFLLHMTAGQSVSSRKTKHMNTVVPVNSSFFDDGDICVVTWSDGTKTTVQWDYEGDYCEELALAIAFIKKFHGLKAYDAMIDSVDKIEREREEAEEARRAALQAEADERARKYNKKVKKAARRVRKQLEFAQAVEEELNNEYV